MAAADPRFRCQLGGRGEKSFSPRKVFIVMSEAAWLSREMLVESERRADWLVMMQFREDTLPIL